MCLPTVPPSCLPVYLLANLAARKDKVKGLGKSEPDRDGVVIRIMARYGSRSAGGQLDDSSVALSQ